MPETDQPDFDSDAQAAAAAQQRTASQWMPKFLDFCCTSDFLPSSGIGWRGWWLVGSAGGVLVSAGGVVGWWLGRGG